MSEKDHYLQFPLCTLALPDPPATVLNLIISYGLTRAGLSIIRDWSEKDRHTLFARRRFPDGVESWLHWLQKEGAQKCNIKLGSADRCEREYERLRKHREDWESRHKADGLVRIRKDLCFEVRDGGGMSFREFRVLCAIYSAIGRSLSTAGLRWI
jgi:hypothetical protein